MVTKKLKCWKKLRKDTWRKPFPKGGVDEIEIEKDRLAKKYVIIRRNPSIKDLRGNLLYKKGFNTKPQVLKSAKSYMKKHDVC